MFLATRRKYKISHNIKSDASVINLTNVLKQTSLTKSITFDSGFSIVDDLDKFVANNGTTSVFTDNFKAASTATKNAVPIKVNTFATGKDDTNNQFEALTDLVKNYTDVTTTLTSAAGAGKNIGSLDSAKLLALASAVDKDDKITSDKITINFGDIPRDNLTAFNTLRESLTGVDVTATITDLRNGDITGFKGKKDDTIAITMTTSKVTVDNAVALAAKLKGSINFATGITGTLDKYTKTNTDAIVARDSEFEHLLRTSFC